MACTQVQMLPRNDQIAASIAIAEELSSLLAAKRRRPVEDGTASANDDTLHCRHSGSEPMKKRVKKTVRFAEDQVKLFNTEDQAWCSWYHKDDYQRIKSENRDTLIAIARANGKLGTIDANSHCIRGLEAQIGISLLNMAPYVRQKTIVHKVLELQKEQRSQKCPDEDALRAASKSISMHDKLKAWRAATIDACKN